MTVLRSCCFSAGLLAALWSVCAALAAPEGNPVADSYQRGVEAYLSGDSAAAEPLLLEAIGEHPKDPRPYYFHALVLLRQGRSDEARSDFMVGAALEMGSRGSYAVGKALERVQDGDRLVLEQYRWQARDARAMALEAAARSRAADVASATMRTDVSALRQKVAVPLERLVQPVSLAELVNTATERPIVAAPAAPVEAAPAPSAPVTAATGSDPFADDPHAAAGNKIQSSKLLGIVGRALFESAPVPSLEGIRKQIPSIPVPGTSQPAQATEAPFGEGAAAAPASDDPFGEPAPAENKAEGAAPPADAAEEDPFG